MQDGKTFASFMNPFKFDAILNSETDRLKVAHLAKQFKTCNNRFVTSFKREFEATERDMEITVDSITSPSCMVKIEGSDGLKNFYDKDSISSG